MSDSPDDGSQGTASINVTNLAARYEQKAKESREFLRKHRSKKETKKQPKYEVSGADYLKIRTIKTKAFKPKETILEATLEEVDDDESAPRFVMGKRVKKIKEEPVQENEEDIAALFFGGAVPNKFQKSNNNEEKDVPNLLSLQRQLLILTMLQLCSLLLTQCLHRTNLTTKGSTGRKKLKKKGDGKTRKSDEKPRKERHG